VLALPKDAVSSGGPLLTILGFIILPLVWSVPEALITAECATMFPENRCVIPLIPEPSRVVLVGTPLPVALPVPLPTPSSLITP